MLLNISEYELLDEALLQQEGLYRNRIEESIGVQNLAREMQVDAPDDKQLASRIRASERNVRDYRQKQQDTFDLRKKITIARDEAVLFGMQAKMNPPTNG